MKKHFITAGAAVLGTVVLMTAAKPGNDPILMNINGKDIRVSEFEYLYNKNNSQQLEPQTLDEYVKMFVDYKLKVADAEAAGIDTTAQFLSEFIKYRNELAAPHLIDTEVEDALVKEAYSHTGEDLIVSHIMVAGSAEGKHLLDSLLVSIKKGECTFEEAAEKYSIDNGSRRNGGKMGYVIPDRFPWAFEKAAYDTPTGGLSDIVDSGFGYHIIRVDERRPASGEVSAEHILLLTRNMSDEEAAKQSVRMDSIYNVAISEGADFADLARRFSQDPGSARNGGSLGWFGRGVMVPEFENVAFSLADGEVSKPFKTSFGYHIIHRSGHRGVAPMSEMRKNIVNKMKGDERAAMPRRAYIERLMKKYKGSVDKKNLDKIEKMIAANPGGYDSTMIATLKTLDIPVISFDGKKAPVSEAMQYVPVTAATDPANARSIIAQASRQLLDAKLLDLAREDLVNVDADYRNLVNEYRDGILLYEISNANVWERASKDKEGLEDYFRSHKDKYKWDQPKFKSYIIFASSDSILGEAMNYAGQLSTTVPADFVKAIRDRFGRDVKVERVIAAKGENAITDYLAFGGEKPAADSNSRWAAYAAFNGRIIDSPEEAADVRGAAVTDYQAELERRWIEELHKKYSVKINEKVLSGLKK